MLLQAVEVRDVEAASKPRQVACLLEPVANADIRGLGGLEDARQADDAVQGTLIPLEGLVVTVWIGYRVKGSG